MISLETMSETIMSYVQQVVDAGASMFYNCLRDQVKTYSGEFAAAEILVGTEGKSINPSPALEHFQDDADLRSITMFELT